MCFDESLCGVCFANSRGDVLVGFQSHISLVTILNYLPPPYLEILSKMNFDNDPFEDHVQFDDLLKFWYDPQRVPRMPPEASKRRPLEPQEIKRPKKRKKVQVVRILLHHFPCGLFFLIPFVMCGFQLAGNHSLATISDFPNL